jgi:hypothetical protein
VVVGGGFVIAAPATVAGAIVLGTGIGLVLGAIYVSDRILDGIARDAQAGDDVVIDDKIGGQLGERGWTEQEVRDAVSGEPSGTSVDNTEGRDDPASVYGTEGAHVVVNDRTGRVVQVSDRNNPGWVPDSRIQWND